MKIICFMRGCYLTIIAELKLFGRSDFIPISGHEGQELLDGSIVCSTCGKVIFDDQT